MSVDGTPSRMGYASKNQNCSVKCPDPSGPIRITKDLKTERQGGFCEGGKFSLPGLRTQPSTSDDNINQPKINLTMWSMIKSLVRVLFENFNSLL